MSQRTSGNSGRARWWAVILAVTLMTAAVGIVGPSVAGAYTANDCKNVAGIPDDGSYPLAIDDGGLEVGSTTEYKYGTTWNTPLSVPAPGVLGNDLVAGPLDLDPTNDYVVAPTGRLRTILWSQASHGTVALNSDGAWTYTPSLFGTPETVEDSFTYVAYDTHLGTCSPTPATVTFQVGGFTEVLGRAPSSFADEYPAGDAEAHANEQLQIDEPGVLANDYNNADFPYLIGSNLRARLLTQPVWEGTTEPAGTVTEWGRRDDQGVTVHDDSGGFTYTAPLTGIGTATFTYRACYRVVGTSVTACSTPAVVSIKVGVTAVAQPKQMITDENSFASLYVAENDLIFNAPRYDVLIRTLQALSRLIPYRGTLRGGAMVGYAKNKGDVQKRLGRIEGQIRGLQRMVDEDTYCIDVLTQISAATKALQAVALVLLDDHLSHCVAEALTEGGAGATEKVAEASAAVARLVRS